MSIQLYLKCYYCDKYFEHTGHKRTKFCSNACRVADWRKNNE